MAHEAVADTTTERRACVLSGLAVGSSGRARRAGEQPERQAITSLDYAAHWHGVPIGSGREGLIVDAEGA
jgi:hypothetical protein